MSNMHNGIQLISTTVTLCLISLIMVCISFSTSHWVEHTVNREKIKEQTQDNAGYAIVLTMDMNYFSRNRGLFKTCYEGKDAVFLDNIDEDDKDGDCIIEKGYEWTSRQETADWGDDYNTRKHLMRCHLFFMAFSILLMIVVLVVCIFACVKQGHKSDEYALGAMVIAVFFLALAVGIFHGYRELERNDIDQPPFEKYWSRDLILDRNTKVQFGYSLYLGWIGFALGFVTTLLLFLTVMKRRDDLRQKDRLKETSDSKMKEQIYGKHPHQPEVIYVSNDASLKPSLYGGNLYPKMGNIQTSAAMAYGTLYPTVQATKSDPYQSQVVTPTPTYPIPTQYAGPEESAYTYGQGAMTFE